MTAAELAQSAESDAAPPAGLSLALKALWLCKAQEKTFVEPRFRLSGPGQKGMSMRIRSLRGTRREIIFLLKIARFSKRSSPEFSVIVVCLIIGSGFSEKGN